jgi:hypothetical protein
LGDSGVNDRVKDLRAGRAKVKCLLTGTKEKTDKLFLSQCDEIHGIREIFVF